MQEINETFNFKSHFGCHSQCQIEIYRTDQGEAIAIATELDSNPGTSITNSYPNILVQACEQYNLDPNKTRWFEHYPGDTDFSEAHQNPNTHWTYISQKDLKQRVADLIESDRK